MDIDKIIDKEKWMPSTEGAMPYVAVAAHNISLNRIKSIVEGHIVDIERNNRRIYADIKKKDERIKELEDALEMMLDPFPYDRNYWTKARKILNKRDEA